MGFCGVSRRLSSYASSPCSRGPWARTSPVAIQRSWRSSWSNAPPGRMPRARAIGASPRYSAAAARVRSGARMAYQGTYPGDEDDLVGIAAFTLATWGRAGVTGLERADPARRSDRRREEPDQGIGPASTRNLRLPMRESLRVRPLPGEAPDDDPCGPPREHGPACSAARPLRASALDSSRNDSERRPAANVTAAYSTRWGTESGCAPDRGSPFRRRDPGHVPEPQQHVAPCRGPNEGSYRALRTSDLRSIAAAGTGNVSSRRRRNRLERRQPEAMHLLFCRPGSGRDRAAVGRRRPSLKVLHDLDYRGMRDSVPSWHGSGIATLAHPAEDWVIAEIWSGTVVWHCDASDMDHLPWSHAQWCGVMGC